MTWNKVLIAKTPANALTAEIPMLFIYNRPDPYELVILRTIINGFLGRIIILSGDAAVKPLNRQPQISISKSRIILMTCLLIKYV